MIPALTIAVAGLVDATNRANGAASNIVQRPAREAKYSAQAASAYGQASEQPVAGEPGRGSMGPLSTAAPAYGTPRYVPSLAEDIVMMREAVHAYKANAKVIRALDDVTRELISVVGNGQDRDRSA